MTPSSTPGAVAAGVGPDGAAFIGVDAAGAPYTVYKLAPVDDEERGRKRERRFSILQSFRIERALQLRRVELGGGVIVVERTHETLADRLAKNALARGDVATVFDDVARALCEMHRAGIVHGALDAHAIHLVALKDDAGRETLRALVDVTALRCTAHADALARACRAPEGEGKPPADVFSLGVLLLACLEGPAVAAAYAGARGEARTLRSSDENAVASSDDELLTLAYDMLDGEPSWRPTAKDVVERLASWRSEGARAPASSLPRSDEAAATSSGGRASIVTLSRDVTYTDDDALPDAPKRIGRFEIEELVGEGAMGRVYKARDPIGGALVAVKILAGDPAPTSRAIRRFKKEARILSEIVNDGVARWIDAGEDDGRLWMAVEYVAGETLAEYLQKRRPMSESEALSIIAELCRALIDVHERGVVHRDLKPENVLITSTKGAARIKLIDFGIARHLDETKSLAMTRQGAVMGTPLYMAPEQARGDVVDARSDVYALGTMLYELLAGEAPFAGHGATLVIAMQQEKAIPKVTEVRPDVSDEAARVVARALEKDVGARYQSARDLLAACERLLGNEPATIAAHPHRPSRSNAAPSSSKPGANAGNANDDGVMRWTFEWDLDASPRALWPYVSNTDRLNRAIGLGAVDENVALDAQGDPLRVGHSKQVGFDLRWKEHPYEWVFERRIGVLREYSEGPLRSMRSTVDLVPRGTAGTHLVHTVEIDPRGLLGRAAAGFEVGLRTRRALDKVYRRIDELVSSSPRSSSGSSSSSSSSSSSNAPEIVDAFEKAPPLSQAKEERLRLLEKKIVDAGVNAGVVARLGDFVRHAAAQDIARIRPVALARRLGVDEDQMVRACLVAAREGMLVPLWDLLCPSCRVPSGIEETLRAVKEHGHCDVCNIDFTLDLATSIEMVFRVHQQIRPCDDGTYCLSSPGKTPHVMAQIRLAPGENFMLETALPEGNYQLVGRRLPYTITFRTRGDGETARWDLSLKDGPSASLGRVLRVSMQEFLLKNDTGREQLVRIERTNARDDVLTAARAAAHPLFRQLFPNEVLAPGAMVRVSSLVLVYADIRGLVVDKTGGDETKAFSQIYTAFKEIEAQVASTGGSVVKLMGDGVLAVFDEPADAVRAALKLDDALAKISGSVRVHAAVHRGPAAAVTLNERLDYFGRSVAHVQELAKNPAGGRVVVSDEILGDPVVQELLDERARVRALRLANSGEHTGPIAIA